MIKPRILLFSRWFAPGYKGGGSQFAVLNLVRALRDDFHFCVVTSNHDDGEKKAYSVAQPAQWTSIEGAKVRYLSPQEFTFSTIHKIVGTTPHDLLHLNSAISPPFSLFPLLAERRHIQGRPILVTPHGELSRGALAQKPMRKWLYLRTARLLRLFENVHWQALAPHEEQDIRHEVSQHSNISVVPAIPGVISTPSLPSQEKSQGQLRVVFLSRIDRMKNLDFAIRMIARIPEATLDIYGPIGQPDYWLECKHAIENSSHKDAIRYCGSVEPDKVSLTLSQYDLFFLPSKGENFGYALLEALAAGCPVLTSDRTPWKNLSALGLGADIPLEMPDLFESFLRDAVCWSEREIKEKRSHTHLYAREFMRNSQSVLRTKQLYLSILGASVSHKGMWS